MKKLVKLASLATILAFGALTSAASPVTVPGVKNSELKTFIVSLNAKPGANGDKERSKVLNELAYKLPKDSYTIKSEYDTLLNGFAIETTDDVAEFIETIGGVSYVQKSHSYAQPETVDGTTATSSSLVGDYAAEKLGNYSAETIDATKTDIENAIKENGGDSQAQLGKGITIGILDTGLILNQVEGTDQRTTAENEAAKNSTSLNPAAFVSLPSESGYDVLTEEKIAATEGLHAVNPQRYANGKIAFAYDYNGDSVSNLEVKGDNDVDPDPVEGVHGTHVASLAAANGDAFQGMAPYAQLAIMKVFPDDASGAPGWAIINALEDAAKLGLDVVNLSLGTDLNDNEGSDSATYQAVQACRDNGVIVNYAAGNSGKSSYSSSQGYSDYTTDTVETGIIGGSSLFDERANIVASTNPEKAFYDSIMMVGDTVVSFDDQVVNKENSSISFDLPHPMTDILGGESTGTFQYLRVGGYGTKDDYALAIEEAGIDATSSATALNNYIAVVDRGTTTFTNKVQAAESYGAKALIVINDNPSVTFNFSFDFGGYNPTIPVVLVYQSVGPAFGETGNVGTLSLSQNQVVDAPDGDIISSFSSDGPSYDLDLIPTIAAPGQNVIGAISADVTGSTSKIVGYDNMSGTSMATPNLTGAMASILSEKKPENNGSLKEATDEDFDEYKNLLSNFAMSNANPIYDATGKTNASPRMQGAGNINVHDTLANESYLTTTVTEDNADAYNQVGDEVSKVELKNAKTLKQDLSQEGEAYIEFSYTVHNDSDEDKTYTPNLSLLIPDLRVQITQSEYDENAASDASQIEDIPTQLPNKVTMSVNDSEVELDADHQLKGTISVEAGKTATGTVKVRIDDIKIHKDFVEPDQNGNREVPSFDGTLREYFNEYFNVQGTAGGSFVEGYLTLTEQDDTTGTTALSMPYMGFYGDYTKGEAVEPFDFEKAPDRLYTSDLEDKYLQNLSNYAKPNAATGSTLSATSSFGNSQMATIANLNGNARAGQSGYLSVQGAEGDDKLYAGAPGVSDVLAATFFVNRSISENSWKLINSNNGVEKYGSMDDWTQGLNYTETYADAGEGTLFKSMLYTASDGYAVHRAFAAIDLSDIQEGEYTLQFSFTPRGTGVAQVKNYTLVVDKTAPELVSAKYQTTSSGKTQLVVTSRGGNQAVGFGANIGNSFSIVPTKVEGSDDLYQATINIDDTMIEANKLVVTFTDYANNSATYMFHPADLGTIVIGDDSFTFDNDFWLDRVSSSNGIYEYDLSIVDKNGNPVKYDGTVTLRLYFGENLDLGTENADGTQTVDCEINYEEATMIYDPTTGYGELQVTLDDGYAAITIFSQISNPDPLPGTSSNTSSNNSSNTSSNSSSSTPTNPGTDDNNPQGNTLPGWGIALIAVGCVAVVAAAGVGVFFFLKKKKAK